MTTKLPVIDVGVNEPELVMKIASRVAAALVEINEKRQTQLAFALVLWNGDPEETEPHMVSSIGGTQLMMALKAVLQHTVDEYQKARGDEDPDAPKIEVVTH